MKYYYFREYFLSKPLYISFDILYNICNLNFIMAFRPFLILEVWILFSFRLVAQPGQRARLITVRSWVRIPASLLLILLIFSNFYTYCQFYRLFLRLFFQFFSNFFPILFSVYFFRYSLFFIMLILSKLFSMYIFMYYYTFIYLKVQYIIREKSWWYHVGKFKLKI